MHSNIFSPHFNKWISIHSSLGKYTLNQYINNLNAGRRKYKKKKKQTVKEEKTVKENLEVKKNLIVKENIKEKIEVKLERGVKKILPVKLPKLIKIK